MSIGLGLNVGLALGAMGGAGGAPAPDFFLPLTSSLTPLIGAGSPTFTRNTTATVWGYDNSGNWTLLTIPSETPRFEGARWTGSAWTDTFPDGSKIPDATLKGYLAEGQRTNLLTYSEQFDNAAWSAKVNITMTANAATAPDGTMTADSLLEYSSTGHHYTDRSAIPVTYGLVYTRSIYAKYLGRQWVALNMADSANNFSYFDIQNGVIGTVESGVTATMTNVGNGWYRLTASKTVSNSNIYIGTMAVLSDGLALTNFAGDTSKGIYLWGAQFEQASFPSSYSATTNTTTTRNADALSYLSSLFSDTAGTAYVELTPLSWGNVAGGILGDGVNNIIAPSNSYGAYAYDGANTANGPSISPSGKVKAAIRWGNGKMRVFANGVAGPESNYDGAFSLSSLLIGNNFYGNIKNVKSWYNRILSDYLCQSMTA